MYTKEQIERAWSIAEENGIKALSAVGSNAKTVKSDLKTEYLTRIMYLAPANQSGRNVCPMASKGCAEACLFTAGRGAMESVKQSRIRKTNFWFDHPDEFKICLFDEINGHTNYCNKNDKLPAVRLNGTSDIVWEIQFPELFDHFTDVTFYDYTKIWPRLMPDWKLPKNYHLTLSRSESNDEQINKVLKANKKANIAVVFETVPKKWRGRRVIEGDEHDLRVLDPKGVIVGLTMKGDAKDDESGFVIRDNSHELILPTIKGKSTKKLVLK